MAPKERTLPEKPAVEVPSKPVVISQLLTTEEAAAALRLKSAGTLAVWRTSKRYPLRFVRIGRKIFYKAEDIQAFIEARTGTQTGACDQRWRDRHESKPVARRKVRR